MSRTTFVVGLDGSDAGARALAFAKERAKAIGDCHVLICYIIEWSPFTFQTAEENDQRHKRREQEIAMAHERAVGPAVAQAIEEGYDAEGLVRHGDAAEIIDALARDAAKKGAAAQIVIGRVGARGLRERIFGGVTGRLMAMASVPVTIIP